MFVCKFCDKQSNSSYGIKNHEASCKLNPNRRIRVGCNKGKTADTCEWIKRQTDTYKKHLLEGKFQPSWLGQHHTEAQKQKISLKMLGNSNNNPDKTGRGKKGWYKGFYCSSTYELAYIIYCLDNDIPIQRYKGYYWYEYNGKKHKYFPDFILEDGSLVEIKGYWTELVDIKANAVHDRKLTILYYNDLKYAFDYVCNKYNIKEDKLELLYE